MKVLVTGGAGFIGHHLVKALLKQGHEICVVDNLSTGNKDRLDALTGSLQFEHIDIRDLGALTRVFNDFRPEQVYHLAALARIQRSWDNPAETYNVNVTGTYHILEMVRKYHVTKLVVTSSSSVFAGVSLATAPHPIKATEDQRPLNPYAYHKFLDEDLVRMYRDCFNINAVIVRPFNVFGEGQNYDSDYSTVIPKYMEYVLKQVKMPVYGDGLQTRDFTYVGDLVRMLMAVMQTPWDEVKYEYNLCSGKPVSIIDIAQAFQGLYEIETNPRKGEAQWTWGENNTGVQCEVSILDWIKQWVESNTARL